LAQFEIKLNGPFGVLNERDANITPTSEKSKALLLLLATAGNQGRSRAWLQSMLWPTASSAANLRNELSVIRKHFANFGECPIEANKKMVFLDQQVCRVDFGFVMDQDRRLCLAEGLDVGEPEFEEWLALERESWANWGGDSEAVGRSIHQKKPETSARDLPLIYVEHHEANDITCRADLVNVGLCEELLTSFGALTDVLQVTTIQPKGQTTGCYQIVISTRNENHLRVSVRLISFFSGRILWTGRFDLQEGEVFDAQETIARNVIETLQERISDGAWSKIWKHKKTSIKAWEAFQRGRQLEARFNRKANLQAIAEYHNSLKHDPEFGPARTAIGFCMVDQVRLGWAEDKQLALEKIDDIINDVEAREPEDFYSHSLHAFSVFLSGDRTRGIHLLRQVVQGNPSSPELTAYLGAMLGHDGQIAEELEKYKLSLSLTSYPPFWIISNMAIAQATLGDPAAGQTADIALLRFPESVRARIAKICSLMILGETIDAHQVAKEVLKIEPSFRAATWSEKDCFTRHQDHNRVAQYLASAGL
jgi:hypothetical protein